MPSEFSALQQMGAAGADNGSGYTDELRNALQHVSMTPQQGPQQAPAGPGEAELHNALANMREFQSKLAVQSKQNEQVLPPATIKVNTADGTLDLGKVPIATYEGFMRDRQQLNEIRGAFHQEAERLKQQEDQTRSQPWVQLATALSANLANQPDMPGWVRGLGQTAAQLNPTADQLRNQRMAVLHQEAQLAESGARLNTAAGEAASRELGRQGSADDKAKKESDTRINNFMKDAFKNAKDGVPMEFAEFNAKADLFQVPQDVRAALYEGHVQQAKGQISAEDRKLASQKDREEFKGTVRTRVQGELIDRQGKIAKDIAGMRVQAGREFLAERYKNMDERQAIGREERAYQSKSEKGVEAINNMRDATARLRVLIAENPDAVGVIEGRIPEMALSRKQAEVRAEFFTLLDAVRQQISGGTRFWNPQEFQNLSPKLAAAKKTERVNLGIMDALDDFAIRGAKNIVKANPDVDWRTRASVFGDIAEEVVGSNVGGLQGPAGGGKNRMAPAAAESAPPVSLLKEGENTEFKNGQVWTLRGGKQVRIK